MTRKEKNKDLSRHNKHAAQCWITWNICCERKNIYTSWHAIYVFNIHICQALVNHGQCSFNILIHLYSSPCSGYMRLHATHTLISTQIQYAHTPLVTGKYRLVVYVIIGAADTHTHSFYGRIRFVRAELRLVCHNILRKPAWKILKWPPPGFANYLLSSEKAWNVKLKNHLVHHISLSVCLPTSGSFEMVSRQKFVEACITCFLWCCSS